MQKVSDETLTTRDLKRQLFKSRVKEFMKNLERRVYETNSAGSTDSK